MEKYKVCVQYFCFFLPLSIINYCNIVKYNSKKKNFEHNLQIKNRYVHQFNRFTTYLIAIFCGFKYQIKIC